MPHSSPQLLEIIQEYSKQTGNKCGLTAVHLIQRTGIALPEMKIQLNQLFVAGEIKVRDGIHGKLIFTNNK